MDKDEQKVKHLEMIQGVINRMAANSFAIKGLLMAIITAGATLTFKRFSLWIYFIFLSATLIFGFLDCYYLFLERKYRHLYNHVRNNPETDFSMDARPFKENFFRTLASLSIWPFYLAIMILPFFLLFIC